MKVYLVYLSSYETGDIMADTDLIFISLNLKKTIDFFNSQIAYYINQDGVKIVETTDSEFHCEINECSYGLCLEKKELGKDLRHF